MASLHSYVVRYDSGFAPNPFHGFCTLATCKPDIRKHAIIGDWVVGCGSAASRLQGKLVYAMRVSEALSFDNYWKDVRFQSKKPIRNGSLKYVSGDNIYSRTSPNQPWQQQDSFHTLNDGSENPRHTARDTGVNRVLVSVDFYYFGFQGPFIPIEFVDRDGRWLCHSGRGRRKFDDPELITRFVGWCRTEGRPGLNGKPWDWR